ncbi:MAG: PepSY-associated TM helix domain-containing protein [Opitutaceae bacterium]|nr:PepSY-associated TM helix domain-containing protein [Opitutaceae bacterium]
MSNLNLLLRRTHLYLGMLLLPWTLMYAVSTALFNHGAAGHGQPAAAAWTTLWEKDHALDLPAGNDGLRETARQVLNEHGLQGPFGVQRQGQRLTINLQNFLAPQRLTYDAERKRLRAEQRSSSWTEVLVRLHNRTGYGQGGFLPAIWGFLIDLFCLGTLAWIGTGLFLWWKLPATRAWGWVALGGGVATFLVLLGTL